MNDWKDAKVIGPFMKFGQVVGLHIERAGETSALHFSSIHDRMDARWNAIQQEVSDLGAWFEAQPGIKKPEEWDSLNAQTDALRAEQRHLEKLYQQVLTYIPQQDMPDLPDGAANA
jgi:hypothetical protein